MQYTSPCLLRARSGYCRSLIQLSRPLLDVMTADLVKRKVDLILLPAAGARARVRNGLPRGAVGRGDLGHRLHHTPLTPAKAGIQGHILSHSGPGFPLSRE